MSKVLLVNKDSSQTVSVTESLVVHYSDGGKDLTYPLEQFDSIIEELGSQGYSLLES